jgi:SSS family solute:Na+ symporter
MIMASLDLIIILGYFMIVMFVGLYYAQNKKETTENYFLAGRNLGWIAIGVSLFATNISSEHFIGLAGMGSSRGYAVGLFEWLAIFALMLLGWVFAPIFLKSKVYTIPEFFGKRFNRGTQMYLSGISIFSYILTKVSVSLFAGGLLLHAILGWDMYTSAVIMLVVTGIYTIIGGYKSVVYTSVVQAGFLIFGALILTGFGLSEVGGFSGIEKKLSSDYFSLFKPLSDPDFPWIGIVFGAPILAVWYWCTDQYIVQRILSAKDINAARRGTLLTGFLKILPMFILVLPGLIAAVLYPGITGDEAYPRMLAGTLLPIGIKGLVVAGVLAALMSSLAACFISTSTLFTMDFYRHFQPNASEKELMLIARLATTAMVVISILWIPVIKILNSQIYISLQGIQAYISPPIAAVFLLGIFWKRINGKGAIWALGIGGITGISRLTMEWFDNAWFFDSIGMQWFYEMNFLHFAILLFGISIMVMTLVSILTTTQYPSKVKDYIVSSTNLSILGSEETTSFSLKQSNRLNIILSGTLLFVLIGIWKIFF